MTPSPILLQSSNYRPMLVVALLIWRSGFPGEPQRSDSGQGLPMTADEPRNFDARTAVTSRGLRDDHQPSPGWHRGHCGPKCPTSM